MHGLVHALLEKFALVKQGSVGYVLEDVSVVDHLLESLHAKDAFNLLVEALVVDEGGVHNDLIHESFHDLFVLLFIEILLVLARSLRRRLITTWARLAHNFLDLLRVLFALICSERVLNYLQSAFLVHSHGWRLLFA